MLFVSTFLEIFSNVAFPKTFFVKPTVNYVVIFENNASKLSRLCDHTRQTVLWTVCPNGKFASKFSP